MADALVGCGGAPAHDTDDLVVLLEQELGEIGSVLAGDSRDERGRHLMAAISYQLIASRNSGSSEEQERAFHASDFKSIPFCALRAQKKRELRELPVLLAVSGVRDHAAATPRGARLILPAARQRVQTFTFTVLPFSSSTRATCKFGFQVRRVALLACERLLPNATPFLHE